MGVQRKGGKKNRKWGRNARRPSTARRKMARPDLGKKVRNILRQNGPAFLVAWLDALPTAEAVIARRYRDKVA